MADGDEKDKTLLGRTSGTVGKLVVICGALAAVVTGIWNVGHLVDELARVRADLSTLQASVDSASEEAGRRAAIQEEILLNLRIAVGSLQAVSQYREDHSSSVAAPTTHRVRHPAPPSHPTSTAVDAGTPFSTEQLILSLPPLPPSSLEPEELRPIVPVGNPVLPFSPTADADPGMELDRADVALQRAEILQDHL